MNITSQPREVIPTAVFPGSNKQGRRYSPFTTNVERLVPFRTLTGRQSYYVDHEVFQQFGESLPVYKPTLPPMVFGNRDKKIKGGDRCFGTALFNASWKMEYTLNVSR